MMTSSNGNTFRVTGPLCGKFTGHRWIAHKKDQWRRALMFSLICTWITDWVNNRKAGDLRHHMAHYDVTVKKTQRNDVRTFLDILHIIASPSASQIMHICTGKIVAEPYSWKIILRSYTYTLYIRMCECLFRLYEYGLCLIADILLDNQRYISYINLHFLSFR